MFSKGILSIAKEYTTTTNSKGKSEEHLRSFRDVPSVIPFRMPASQPPQPLGESISIAPVDAKKPLAELDLTDPEQQAQAREEIKLLEPERLVYTSKPIAIVVNPSSGKKRDLRPLIQTRLEQAGIPFEFHLSTKYFMTWEIAETIDLDKYSALVAVGGDGTYHEVVNGMLHRPDKKRIPIGFIPNGSGNDTLRSLWVTDPAKALDYMVKGDLLTVDLTRVMFDFDSDEELEKMSREEKIRRLRYQLINSSYGTPAKLNFGA